MSQILAGLPNTVLALIGIGLTLFIAKDKLKIEGLAYRNPNNRIETQTISLLSYSTPSEKNEIIDNEKKCQYQFDYQKALLVVKTKQKGCERFTGIYRPYD